MYREISDACHSPIIHPVKSHAAFTTMMKSPDFRDHYNRPLVHNRALNLHADVAETFRHDSLRAIQQLPDVAPGRMRIAISGFAMFPTGQLINRHARLTTLDVPERLIDAADRVAEIRPVAPIRAVVHGLPRIVDAVGRFTDEEGPQIFSTATFTTSALGERAAPIAAEPS